MYVRYKQECGTGKGGIRIGAYDGYMMANKEQTQKNGEFKQKDQKSTKTGIFRIGRVRFMSRTDYG